ncbi:hypothetical protein T4E_11335 [Trichinella pseudospiralis]|uniref:Uncharacterized protein n=1 Tax=Trichinella pseudospiralis TaxID=6337 RepID=A0A0V0Y3Q5_TRIPS|nr:hypothetical protein T4E_11335 [Trichinella pseudospiralis]
MKCEKSSPPNFTFKIQHVPSPGSSGKALAPYASNVDKTTMSHLPLMSRKPRHSPLQDPEAWALTAKEQRRSSHSPSSKGRELHAPRWGLVWFLHPHPVLYISSSLWACLLFRRTCQ